MDDAINEVDEKRIKTLGSRPIYMSIIRTIEGKPIGYPIWNNFMNNPNERRMENEVMASTLLSLAKTLSKITSDENAKGKYMKVNFEGRSYNIYSPHRDDDFQISFVAIFEARDDVLIRDEYKEELTRTLVEQLQTLPKLNEYLNLGIEEPIEIFSPLHQEIEKLIEETIEKWDKKRVKYLREKELAKLKEIEREKELERLGMYGYRLDQD